MSQPGPSGPLARDCITNRQRAAVCIPGHPLYTTVHWFKRSDKRELYVNAIKTACCVLGSIKLCETASNYTIIDELPCWPYSTAAARLLFKSLSDKYAIKPAMKMVTEAVAPSNLALIKSLLPCSKLHLEADGIVYVENPAWGAVASAMIASAIKWDVHFSMKPGLAFMRFEIDNVDLVKLTRVRCAEVVNMIRNNPNMLPPSLQ